MFRVFAYGHRSIQLGVYIVAVVLLSAVVLFTSARVGTTILSLVDEAILDGSGHQTAAAITDSDMAAAMAASRTTHPDTVGNSQLNQATKVASITTVAAPRAITAPVEVTESDPAYDYYNGGSGTYRTYCVRLCDGYFFPISFSTTSDKFESDAARCQQACGSPARLFVHQIPGGSPAGMTTVDGLPYKALKTAFLFRTRYDAQCKCQAQPWEQQAQTKHRLYAAEKAAEGGSRKAAAEVAALQAAVKADTKVAEAEKQKADQEAQRELAALTRKVGTQPVQFTDRRPNGPKVAAAPSQRPLGFGELGTMMRLGSVENSAPSKGWRPASGNDRHWHRTVFEGN